MKTLFVRLAALVSACIPLLAGSAQGAEINAIFNSSTSVPVTAASYTATGNTVNLALNFAPSVGTTLTVVNNTGISFIQGQYDNLAHGQLVDLAYNGIAYPLVANYFGGTGNDLVLQWANVRLLAWGRNTEGQLGNNETSNRSVPVPVDMRGVLAGKTVTAVSAGAYHGLALCSDGTLAAWGENSQGQLGNNGYAKSSVPVAVDQSGVLAGRTVIAVAAGNSHNLALCSDGTLVAWGRNSWGELGLGDYANSIPVPQAVKTSGVLAGKRVIAIGAGYAHSVVLCADGTLAAWGANVVGELGNNSTVDSREPVAVDQTGVLAGRTVSAISVGGDHCLARCADGALVAWGSNGNGQLGNGNTTDSSVPVLSSWPGGFTGKVVSAIAAGANHSLAQCTDGTLVAWGNNGYGQLGDGSGTQRSVPVAVNQTGVLSGKSLSGLCPGSQHSMVVCADGSLATWGFNYYGQLGNGTTTNRAVPGLVDTAALRTGERFVPGFASSSPLFSFAVVASPPLPVATTLEVSGVTDTGVTLNGTVNANGQSTVVGFEYGLTTDYGTTAAPIPATLTGTTSQALAVTLSNLPSGSTYHYRVVATSAGGAVYGEDRTFITSNLASLSGLSLSAGTLNPGFASIATSYSAVVPYATSSLTVTPVAENAASIIRVQGVTVGSGTASAPLALAVGNTTITVAVTPPGASFSKAYTVVVTRSPETYVFNSATTVPVTASAFDASGRTVAFSLGFAPATGTDLTVVRNTGQDWIIGEFGNLTQGQKIELTHNGVVYPFLANYFGGTGNDLVLQWGNTRLFAWGSNSSGQLGQDHTADGLVPAPVLLTGALTGKAILSVATGGSHSLALCADGSLVSWGDNYYGQLGDNSEIDRLLPVAVDQSGVLAGKRVMAVSAGSTFSLALCDDGTLAAWGANGYSQLGDGTQSNRMVPVLATAGALAGKQVSAVVAGAMHAVALCTDGTLVAWGSGNSGQMGNGTAPYTSPPVVVTKGTVLTGKTIVSLASGYDHSMVLCSDGTLAAWGSNGWGAVGNNSATNATTPVAVVKTGVLSGKTITAIAAGASNSLALCSDNTLATWGDNTNGRLGNGSTTYSKVPVAVTRTGVLSGKTIVAASPWTALCSDGVLATWGDNTYGQLGNNTTTHSTTPVLPSISALRSGEKMVGLRSASAFHLAVVAAPPAASVTTLAATGIGDHSGTVGGTVKANGQVTTASFEYGLTTGYGSSVAATPSSVTGTAPVTVSAVLAGLLPGKTYHYRGVVSSGGGTVYGADQVFTTTALATLAGLVPSMGNLVPVVDPAVSSYSLCVLPATADITLTPTVAQQGATVTVAGIPVTSGSASGPVTLAVGNTAIPVVVTAADAVTTMTYTVTVTRPPVVLAFNAAADVPVTAAAFDASGMTATFALGFAPPPGTVLTVVNQTGLEFIRGAFDNLAQGQEVEMAYAGVRYRFIANYFGGTGNDLVLQWANVRLMAWGSNSSGQIGNGGELWNGSSYTNRNLLVPTAADATGVLAEKTVMMAAAGGTSSLALCADGTLAAWGEGGGRLGNGTTAGAVVPVLVDRSGVLADKTVVSLAVGSKHCLALCADGTVAAWGDNASGQLGNNSTTASTVPVMVDTSGVLAGRKVVMIATTGDHNLALCGDGTLVAWGENGSIGQLGNNSSIDSSVPVLVETGGVLQGRRVVEIAAGGGHSAALCADGTLAVWGLNYYGQLGLGNKIDTKVPVALPMTGVLAGKTIRSVSANYYHTMVWCTDGTLAAWGYNYYGALGNSSTTDSMVPVAVVRSGVLSGKTVTRIATGWAGSGVLCSDGKMATWGGNGAGQLGNNSTTNSNVPVLVNMTGLRAGERFVLGQMNGINSHTLALVGSVPEPSAVLTLAATATHDKGTTFNASVNANGSATTVTFEYGLTTAYGTVVSATPATVTGTTATPVSAMLAGLPTGTAFHYRVIAASAGGVVKGEDQLVTTTDQATLAGLAVSAGTLDPGFAPVTTSYAVTVPAATATFTLRPVASHADAVITVNGRPVVSGAESEPVALAEGNNVITVGVTSGAGTDTGSYTLRVLRVPQGFRFTAASTVGIAVSSLRPAGAEVRFELGFAPVPGCVLTVVDNTGSAMIAGEFDNLAHGQRVELSYGGATYPFVANYYGGTGNDLVLQWAATKLFSWGYDSNGELGDNSTGSSSSQLPVEVYTAGVLAGKTVMAVSVGSSNAAALCADGTVATWGYGFYGRLGNGELFNNAGAPVAVTMTGVLAGKKVVAIAVGGSNTLVLCSDGTLAAWGYNASGQLGDNTTAYRTTPVLVDSSGVLAGKVVTAIACGESHSLVLCADGTLAAWGAGSYGQLGNGGTLLSKVPVAVTMTGVLAGKTVTAIAAGDSLSFALCADGTVAAWGRGDSGQLGNGATNNSAVPVLLTRTGVLAGKTVTGVAAGSGFGVARCADGTLGAWGTGALLGAGGIANSNVPVLVNRAGVLAGKTVTSLAAGFSHTLVGCSDGTAAAWGSDSNGQLGDSTAGNSVTAPVAVATSTLPAGARFMTLNDGGGSGTSVAMVALPPPPTAATLAATAVLDAGATLNASVQPNGVSTAVSFEYGPTTAYGTTVQASPATVTGTGSKSASHVLGGLKPGATYHFRVVLTSASGMMRGNDLMFTTTTLGTLAGLTVAPGSVFPAFDSTRTDYAVTVPNAAESLRVTPVTAFADAAVTVNGLATVSGSPSAPVALAPGNTSIPVVVTSGDGKNTKTYQIVVTRLPESFAWPSATTVPVTAADFLAAGNAPLLSLGHAPQTGASLMVVNNTGSGPIRGGFGNLADGQRVELGFGGISYVYFVNYAGGTGNDLVLEWGNTRVMTWGSNSQGQLGDGTIVDVGIPTAVRWGEELTGTVVRDVRAGFKHSLALTWDGVLVTWGSDSLDSDGSGDGNFPREVPATGALAGKKVQAIAVGDRHNLALCTDGTLAAWGYNYRGQLGNDSTTTSYTPVLVNRTGALAGKDIVAIEAGSYSSVALCSDGTVVQWGWLSGSQYPAEISLVPVSMQDRGALVGKKVVKLRAGFNNWLALCSDGSLLVWGSNMYGEFGNGTAGSQYYDDRYAPVAVTMTGVLAGKTIKDMAVGNGTCLVLCTDGTLVSWGSNSSGQLGIGTKTHSNVPVRVTQTGVLAGKTVVRVFAGSGQCYALCSDGSMAAWGANSSGSLGNGTTTESTLPVLVSTTNFATGETFMTSGASASASGHALALSALPPAPAAATLAATAVSDTDATLNAEVQPNGSSTQVAFEYGRTTAYGSTVSVAPLSGTGTQAASLTVTNLSPGTIYHFRVIASNSRGAATGADRTFTTSALATLAGLGTSVGELNPGFAAGQLEYSVTVPPGVQAVALTPVVANAGATVKVNGVTVETGRASADILLGNGATVIPVEVTSRDGGSVVTYQITVDRVPERFVFGADSGAGLSAAGFVATGCTAEFKLAYAPPVGTQLTVVDNTGIGFIRGTFDNLRQGQRVVLKFGEISYVFVANYFGGTGNDLVLQWANTRLMGWGTNTDGQLGDNTTTNRTAPVAVTGDGVLSGKTITAVSCGGTHTLAVCSDGTVAAWGANTYGQLGNNSKTRTLVPVAVDLSGELAGKTVVAVAAGTSHSLALCSDGTLAAWGLNTSGQLGNAGLQISPVPVVIDNLGVLAGREIVAIAAGRDFNLAVTADGLLAAWGYNELGQLGDGGTSTRLEPVAVGENSVLSGRRVKAVAAGANHNLALCADGTLVAWGYNNAGQLGDGTTTTRLLPVKVAAAGALVGRQVARIVAGGMHSLAWCTDGALTAWGYNNNGELGIGNMTATAETVPQRVITTGALAGKTIRREVASASSSAAMCTDGTLVAWGGTPTAVSTVGLAAGERFADCFGNLGTHLMATVARPVLALATTLAATAVGETSATLNAEVSGNGGDASVSFEYGITTAYGSTLPASPATVTGTAGVAVTGELAGLVPGAAYHFRVKAVNAGGTAFGEDRVLTPSDLAGLAQLVLSPGQLSPMFNDKTTDYVATVPFETGSVTLAAQAKTADAVVRTNGVLTDNGVASAPIGLPVGNTRIAIEVSAEGGTVSRTYAVTVTRLPESLVFHAPDDVPVTAGGIAATGMLPVIRLDFAPVPGTTLTLINNTAEGEIAGTFANLAHGQSIEVAHAGALYPFVADYTGGSGNDLVLRWGNSRLMAWWDNSAGQLGDGSFTRSDSPTPVLTSGALAGKLVTAVSAGNSHVLALCADGTVAAWGINVNGQLGINSTTPSAVPIAVDTTGALAGKRVVRIAAGTNHNLVLCSDGTLASWGSNSIGQLGIPTGAASSLVPVAVSRIGALAGKTVTGIGVGEMNSYAICSDGTVIGWGSNTWGQLGNGANIGGHVPVAVDTSGVLAGKRVVSIDGGTYFCVALCSDGTLAAWGYNSSGQLGNNLRTDSWVPVEVDRSGVLAGKTVTLISVGPNHALARCADGTLASWGYNGSGQLGNPVSNSSAVPVLMNTTGVLVGKTVTAVAAAGIHSLGLCDDGTTAYWGPTPTAVGLTMLQPGERFTSIACGSGFNIGIVVSPQRSLATTVEAGELADTAATLRGRVNANGGSTQVKFEYGLTESYGTTLAAAPSSVAGTADTEVSVRIGGLLPGTVYHFRVLAPGGAGLGADKTFTTTLSGTLASLTPGSGGLSPVFDPKVTDYALTVPATASSVTLTPVAAQSAAVIKVNDVLTESGAPSAPVDLSSGTAVIAVAVDAGDGVNSRTYRVTVTRLPAVFAFDAPSTVPATAERFGVEGLAAVLELRHAPSPGADLTVLHSTGGEPIFGNFANLAHGQIVLLEYQGLVYRFVANYYGGKGNDLVLQWADRRVFGWGRNDMGQLPGRTGTQMEAAELDLRAVLTGRTILDASAGASHMLLLLDNGTIASWGSNSNGQTGHGGSGPAIVDRTGVLAGKTVVQIAAGMQHNLALCSDGTLVAWGNNTYGALGDGTSTQQSRPVVVPRVGALAGRRPLALAAGASSSLVLCTDGTLVAWGSNSSGELGNGSTTSSAVPVAVEMGGVLNAKEIRSIALANGTCFALCADGTLAAWGSNQSGMIGDNTTVNRSTPVRIDDKGALVGKTVVTVVAGSRHNHALCTDGSLVAWGSDSSGYLGDGGPYYGTQSPVPVLVDRSGVLAAKTVTTVAAGDGVAGCVTSDGNLFFWGTNDAGILGIGSGSPSGYSSPVAVSRTNLSADLRFIDIVCSKGWGGSYAFVDGPLAPIAETLAATPVGDASATLRGAIRPNDSQLTVAFEYGLTTSYGTTLTAVPGQVDGTAMVPASAAISGLLPATTYHYRVIVTCGTTGYAGGDITFTTGAGTTLAALSLDTGTLAPAFEPARLSYGAVVDNGTENVIVTPLAAVAGATVTVNGTSVASGSSSQPLPLAEGNNPLVVAVTSASGKTTTNYQITVTRLPAKFRFNHADEVPVTVDGFTATGRTVAFELGFTPPPGTRLTAVRNIGGTLIGGVFDNLAQGEVVTLDYGGRSFRFAANYRGGSGNDLVLEWAAGRVLRWGSGTTVPTALDTEGILHGGTVVQVAASNAHRLLLMADGSLYGMGEGSDGRLGHGGTYDVRAPLRLNGFGALAGRAVVAVAAGEIHGLALCADGTLTAWGSNGNGQLGIGDNSNQTLPVEVDRSGVLTGRRIVALAASSYSSYALCEDGAIAAWGSAYLGNGSTGGSTRPVLVDTSGVLAGKQVVSLAVGPSRVVALCADGFLAAWGTNTYGALGNGSTTHSTIPVAVDRSGVLAGKTVVSVAAAGNHTLVLCSDGSLAAWGAAPTGTSNVPVIVNPLGALAGKTVVGIAAGEAHGMALCSDGTVATWGSNSNGQLGNGTTTTSSTPVAASLANLVPGERVTALVSSPFSPYAASHAWTALPDWLEAVTLPASPVAGLSATLRGRIETGELAVNRFFDYGPTADYGSTAAANPALLTGGAAAVEAVLTGLAPGTTYHYRVRCTTPLGTVLGEDLQFTTATVATLSDLRLSQGVLGTAFSSAVTRYAASVPASADAVALTPIAATPGATIKVNGDSVTSGSASAPIPMASGANTIVVKVTSPDGGEVVDYTVVVTRLPERFVFGSATDIPLTTDGFSAAGISPVIVLGFAPPPGLELTLVRNTGEEPVQGAFTGLAQGQSVLLDHAGTSYRFVANYYGGSGNDLVLRWANTRVVGWGSNTDGQLGNGLELDSAVPTAAGFGGLTGKPTVATVCGGGYGLALGAGGLLEAAGANSYGNLGNGTTTDSLVPVAVDRSGVLAGKTVVTVAAGRNFNLALCADGTVAAWGAGQTGTLGNGIEANSSVPVAVDRSGALAGKRVIALAGGENHSLALCADGTVAAWGYSPTGALGVGAGASTYQSLPLRVATDGVLAGRRVMAISAGGSHSLALCTDGTVAAWGSNDMGQLGDNSTSARMVPVEVDASGALAGKTVVAIAAGWQHSLALCADGALVAWGRNASGQLGNNSVTNSPVPVAVDQSGILAGKSIVSLAVGSVHSMVFCGDGSVIGWGSNSAGQLGNMISGNQLVPTAAVINTLAPGERIISLSTGIFSTNMAIVAMPVSTAVSGGADAITGTSATLHGKVNARNSTTTVAFEYGVSETYGSTAMASPAAVSGRKDTAVGTNLNGLSPGTTYHYRVVAESRGGIARGTDMTFTTLSDNAKLAALDLSDGMLAPVFEKLTESYVATVPFAIDGVAVIPTKDHFGASVKVEGVPVASGTASGVIPLAVGNTTITIVVTAEDGIATKAYAVTVTRLPQEFVFNSGADIPVAADGFTGGGVPVVVRLGYAPVPGTILTMVNNTSLAFIYGRFSNLAQGQRVTLGFGGKGYDFVANYFGGTGNDLVLQWADTEVFAWGYNNYGQLGDSTTTRRLLPTSGDHSGVLAGKTIVAVSGGYLHSLALCSDGTLASWGYNVFGQLGNNGTAAVSVPAAVDRSGDLAGKSVIAISAGPFHNLALCADGTLTAWGYNNHGQLGTGDKVTARAPVLVKPVGALTGKQVVAIAAGTYQSFALCSDGSVAAWGYNDEGELGNGLNTGSLIPVTVALSGKKVASLSAGQYHSLALCTDGTLLAWGYNQRGQLGNATTIDSNVPVVIGGCGNLTDKAVSAVAAGGSHSLALCADGSLAAWGFNHRAQIGVTGATQSASPVALDLSGILVGRTIAGLIPGGNHNLARLSDGTLVAWGDNTNGQLGDNSTEIRTSPVTVNLGSLPAGARPMFGASGTASSHNLLVVGLPASSPGNLDSIGQNGFTGTATQDSNQNGISDLIEYAFGLVSNENGTGQLPQGRRIGDRFKMQFTQPAGVIGITYGAEWSRTLEPGSWMEVPDTGNGEEHVFSVPMEAESKVFMRLKVRAE